MEKLIAEVGEAIKIQDRHQSIEMDVTEIQSPVLNRLIEEVRNERELSINAYNRMHNRHNRSR